MSIEIVKECSIRVRIDKKLKDKFIEMCEKKDITMSEFIINAIKSEIERYEFNIKNEKITEKRIEEVEKKLKKLKEKLNA